MSTLTVPAYVMTAEERQDEAKAELCAAMREAGSRLRAALMLALAVIEAIDVLPLCWPNSGYDQKDTLSLLRDLLPDRSEADIERTADELLQEAE